MADGSTRPGVIAATMSALMKVPEDTPGSLINAGPSRSPNVLGPDIGHLAKWSVSSYKFGFGAECLRDGDSETFWHSDGPQPHFITIEFPRKVAIQKISVYLSFLLDDSYTPSTLAIRAGTGPSDLQDIRIATLDKPEGWITFDVSSELVGDEEEGFKPVYAYILQIIVVANHMSGKDTHVRGLRVLGPIDDSAVDGDPFPFVATKFKMYDGIR